MAAPTIKKSPMVRRGDLLQRLAGARALKIHPNSCSCLRTACVQPATAQETLLGIFHCRKGEKFGEREPNLRQETFGVAAEVGSD